MTMINTILETVITASVIYLGWTVGFLWAFASWL